MAYKTIQNKATCFYDVWLMSDDGKTEIRMVIEDINERHLAKDIEHELRLAFTAGQHQATLAAVKLLSKVNEKQAYETLDDFDSLTD